MSRDLLDQIVNHAVAEDHDDDAYWEAVYALQKCDVLAVWDLVEPLSRDDNPRLRAVAPDVLRYLGGPALPLAERTVALFRNMLATEKAPRVISSIGCAFVDLSRRHERVELMLPFAQHPAREVRSAVVHGYSPAEIRRRRGARLAHSRRRRRRSQLGDLRHRLPARQSRRRRCLRRRNDRFAGVARSPC